MLNRGVIKKRLIFIVLRANSLLSYIAPSFMGDIAYKRWFRTFRHATPKRETDWIKTATQRSIPTPNGQLSILMWRTKLMGARIAPKILLIHGWSGRASQMGAFAEPLCELGFDVISVDLPGHGLSSGDTCSMPEAANALFTIEKEEGSIHGVIGHSFGGAVSMLAASEGLNVNAVVTIGMPKKLSWLLDLYAKYLMLSPAASLRITTLLEKQFGDDIWRRCDFATEHIVDGNYEYSTQASNQLEGPSGYSIDTEKGVTNKKYKILVVHDENDKEVPVKQGYQIAKTQGATLHVTTKLGHFRILRNETLINEIADFMAVSANRV